MQCQKKKRCGSHYWARARTEKRALSTSLVRNTNCRAPVASSEPLVLRTAASGLQEPHRHSVESRRCAGQLQVIPCVRLQPGLRHGRGECSDLPTNAHVQGNASNCEVVLEFVLRRCYVGVEPWVGPLVRGLAAFEHKGLVSKKNREVLLAA